MKKQFRISNGPARAAGKPWFSIKDEASAPAAEILIYDQIGESYWGGDGTGAKAFAEGLKAIPTDREILVRINSPGGDVYDGIAIYTQLRSRRNKVVTQIDGVAASIASVIALAGREVRMARAAQFMIHDPSTIAYGTVADMEKAISALESAKESILVAYMEKTGKDKKMLGKAMTEETWFTGDTAKEYGFVDAITADAPASNTFDFSAFKNVPEGFRKPQNSAPGGSGQQTDTIMNREELIALLKKHGVTADANATVEQLKAQLETILAKASATPPPANTPAPSAVVDDSTKRIEKLEAKYEGERKQRIEREVDACIADRRVLAEQREFWVKAALADEAMIAKLQAMPQNIPPAGTSVEIVSDSIQDIGKHIVKLSNEIKRDIISNPEQAVVKAVSRARHIRKNEDKIAKMWNEGTNTVDAQLQQDVIIDHALRAFKRVLLPMSKFATIFSNVALRGTDKVQVPYLALDATTATDWVAATGYVAGDTTNDNREITVNKRKYLGISYTSSELARQPFLLVKEQMELKGESLAFQVWKDVWSVVTAANYGAASTGWPKAASAMDSNSLIDLITAADSANWPMAGRLLFVNSAYNNYLMKDNAFKNAMAFGGTEVLREGKLPNILGFEYATNVNLQDNSENLAGVIMQRNAILVATAPIPPTEEVIRDGTQYSIAVDPDSGVTLEYRSFGDSQKDKSLKFIESNYGYAKGIAANLQRLTTP